jgi:hypothetical protein
MQTEVTYSLAGIFLQATDFRQRRASTYGRIIEAEMTRRVCQRFHLAAVRLPSHDAFLAGKAT